MKWKRLQDFANALPHRLVGESAQDDLEILADLPDGSLSIDLIERRASHSHAPELSLPIVGELSEWLREQMSSRGLPPDALERASLTASFRTDRIPTDRKWIVSFDIECESVLEAAGRTYRGDRVKQHVWHNRKRP
jgi:hypothetical protein